MHKYRKSFLSKINIAQKTLDKVQLDIVKCDGKKVLLDTATTGSFCKLCQTYWQNFKLSLNSSKSKLLIQMF